MREAFETALRENVYDELTHRAFADWLYENGFDEEAEYHALWTKEWQQAKEGLEDFAARLKKEEGDDVTIEELVNVGTRYIETGKRTTVGDFLGMGLTNFVWEHPELLDKFWVDWKVFTRYQGDKDLNRVNDPFGCCGGDGGWEED